MMLTAFFFYVFAFAAVASAFMVIASRNPIYSVLFLILAFINAAGLFMLMGAEFLALILLIVYIGAVAVLFLFVVMMLDVDFVELRQGFLQYLPVGVLMGVVVLVELLLVVTAWVISPTIVARPGVPIDPTLSNTEVLGGVLYTRFFFFFQAAGLVLLVAMVGAIVLTLRHKTGVKRQDAAAQSARTIAEAIEIRKVHPGRGI